MTKSTRDLLINIGITPLILPQEKFHLKTKTVEDRKQIPNPFYPRIKKLKLVSMITKEVLQTGLRFFFDKEERKVVLSRPCIYGVFGGPLGGLMPRREYCTGCMRCVLEYPDICTVDRNPDFVKYGDSYWIPKDPSIAYSSPMYVVNYEAKTGKIPIKGMGYKGAFAGEGWDSMWTDMSEIVRPTRDGVHGREYISTNVDLGRKPEASSSLEDDVGNGRFKVVKIPVPILFDQVSKLSRDKSVLESVWEASKQIPTLFIEEPKSFSVLDIPCKNKLWVPLVGSSEDLDFLRAMKYEPLVLEFSVFSNELLSEIKNEYSTSILFYRLERHEDLGKLEMALKEESVDGIHLVANYHGMIEWGGEERFIKDVVFNLHSFLVEKGLREEVTLIAGGGITMAEHVPKAIIMGADAVSIDTSLGVALQLEFPGEVVERGVHRLKDEKIDANWGRDRITNLIGSWHAQLIEILSAMGMRDVRRLRGDIGRAMFHEELEKEAFGDLEWR